MKKFFTFLLSILLCAQCLPLAASAADAEPDFSDMHGHWAEGAAKRLAAAGILSGYPDGTFRPGSYVTRAEAAKILCLAFGLDEPDTPDYPDLDPNAWYYPYAQRADKYMPLYPPI